ncbi:uncharacterized protein HRG_11459 [Hirsutella rhossiliensis]|uniref:Pre-mRNA-splicing factor Syf1/CRNKL1-like C-terminal HAT-repeats domain-containing protein n=1 Tax=Hirsutella rhossiliensis TaxID=111463 RepID=A0A9P8MQD5_9HYPO|nr:uncharacterized protein HRG_11459 [Hirsutella rhossiliensis]KAH0957312.1 hypothetical protein HRG_11459 [Hirsutella rhossiliensis]
MVLHKAYTTFEKQFGDQDGVEDVVLSKRRRLYEEQVRENPKNYDAWFDYARLEESAGDADRVRDVYERAVAQVPPTQEKRHWRRYIYLWIFYAIWEELEGKDVERTRQIYSTCLDLIPRKKFTFAKMWLLAAQFEVRQGQLAAARNLLWRAVHKCPKDKIFNGFIDLERRLFEFVRCRTLYEKHVEHNPANCQTWIKFAELERGLDDLERTRAIFELAISQAQLDMPELLWKAYIDFEEEEGEYERTRELYERLLAKTDHVKVWISYAHFEINIPEEDEEGEGDEEQAVSDEAKARARGVFERAHKSMRDKELKEERVSLLNAWLSFERTHGSGDDMERVQRLMPRRTRRRRLLDDGSHDEYVDYVFPADEQQAKSLSNVLALAQKWKQTGGDLSGAAGGE